MAPANWTWEITPRSFAGLCEMVGLGIRIWTSYATGARNAERLGTPPHVVEELAHSIADAKDVDWYLLEGDKRAGASRWRRLSRADACRWLRRRCS